MSGHDPVAARRVEEIMRRDVVTVRPETTVRELVRLFSERRIGGAPVVGERGELVGIVSATDLVRLAARAAESPLEELLSEFGRGAGEGEAAGLWSFLSAEAWAATAPDVADEPQPEGEVEYEEYTVRDLMQRAPRSVAPTDSLGALARLLFDGRMHRAPVVEGDRLVGIVTSFDVLRALAEAAPPR